MISIIYHYQVYQGSVTAQYWSHQFPDVYCQGPGQPQVPPDLQSAHSREQADVQDAAGSRVVCRGEEPGGMSGELHTVEGTCVTL